MKILLVNDTSLQDHFGCLATMNGLRRYCQERNITVTDTIFCKEIKYSFWGDLNENLILPKLLTKIKNSDLIIINGEGTMHDGQAPEVEFIMQQAKDLKTPFAMVNACIRNYKRLLPLLKDAAFISVRDSRSREYLAANNIEALRCADAAVFSELNVEELTAQTKQTLLFTDWHSKLNDLVSPIAEQALKHGANYFPLRRPDALENWQNVLQHIKGTKLISARYHGTVFATMAGASQIILPSNTDKMTAFAHDYGLESQLADTLETVFTKLESDAQKITAEAQEKILSERSDPAMHPLSFLDKKSVKTLPPLPKRKFRGETDIYEQTETDYTNAPLKRPRRLIDYLAGFSKPETTDAYSKIIADCEALSLQEIDGLGHLTKQENCPAGDIITGLLYTQKDRCDQAFPFLRRAAQKGDEFAIRTLIKNALKQGKHLQILRISEDAIKAIKAPAAETYARLADLLATLRIHDKSANYYERAIEASKTSQYRFKYLRQLYLAGNHQKSYKELIRHLKEEDINSKSYDETFEIGKICFSNKDFEKAWNFLSPRRHNMRSGRNVSKLCSAELLKNPDAFADKTVAVDLTTGIGLGVEFKYLSLIQRLKTQKLYVQCDPRITNIIERSFPGTTALPHGETLPHSIDIILDYAELGALLCPDENSFVPAGRTVLDRKDKTQELRQKYKHLCQNRPLIGLSWATGNKNTQRIRNVELSDLLGKIKSADDLGFVSLQSSLFLAQNDIENLDGTNTVIIDNDIDPLTDMDDYVSQIAAMDVVITIDCSTVHIAGALGIPTYMINKGSLIWKWPQTDHDQYWHKSVKIIDFKEIDCWKDIQTTQDKRKTA